MTVKPSIGPTVSKPVSLNPAYPAYIFPASAVYGAKLMLELQETHGKLFIEFRTVNNVLFFERSRSMLSLSQLDNLRSLQRSNYRLFGGMMPGSWLRAELSKQARCRTERYAVFASVTTKDFMEYHKRIYTFFATQGQSELKEQQS